MRTIPITTRIAPLLGSWFSKHESLGLSVRSIQRTVRDVAARAGIERPVCAEALRHTFALAAVRSGISPLELRRLLGHKRLSSSEAYFDLGRGG
jgi:site-specific recombinase XerD